MIEKALLDYFQTQQAIVETNWLQAKHEQDMETLHDLRVGIKRLKAVYQLGELLTKGAYEYKLHFADLRALFKAVGRLRDLQVQNQVLSRYLEKEENTEKIRGYYTHLQSQHEAECEQLEQALHVFHPRLLEESFIDLGQYLQVANVDEKGIKLVIKYLNKKLKAARKKSAKRKEEEKMHDMRSLLKQAAYALELLLLFMPEVRLSVTFYQLKEIGSLMGDWHDHVMLAKSLNDYYHDFGMKPPPVCRKVLGEMKEHSDSKLNKALKKLNKIPKKVELVDEPAD